MSVATMLGVADVTAGPMSAARNEWNTWRTNEPALDVVDDLLDLPGWTRTADFDNRDSALRALAKLGSVAGGGEESATTALSWLLVPGAANIARQLGDLTPDIDAVVASHLWTSAKTFDWDRRNAAAQSILRDTRRGVLAEAGVGDWARRRDRTWCESTCVDPADMMWQHIHHDETDQPAAELLALLSEASEAGVISSVDRSLLIELALAADAAGAPGHRGRGGLMAPSIAGLVGASRGLASVTIRRRAADAIAALRDFSQEMLEKDTWDGITQATPMALSA